MDINMYISALVQYGLDKKLIEPCDKAFIINQLLTPQQLDSYEPAEIRPMALEQILKGLTDDAVNRGIISDDITSRDLAAAMALGSFSGLLRLMVISRLPYSVTVFHRRSF